MKIGVGAFLGVALSASLAQAQPADSLAAHEAYSELADGTITTVQEENDLFVPGGHSDRYYTQGLQISILAPASSTPFASRARDLPFMDKTTRLYRAGVLLGQNIYTPQNLRLVTPDPNDRPYAGWLYAGGEVLSYSAKELNSLQLQVGVVGPMAGGEWVQNNWHRRINRIREAKGWNSQIKDEVAFALYGERTWRPKQINVLPGQGQGGLDMDFTPHAGFALGTVQVAAGGGAMLRIGTWLNDDFGPPRIHPGPSGSAYFGSSSRISAYAFAGFDGRVVAHDLFLDGNTFRHSARVDREALVGEFQAGAVARIGLMRLTYSYARRTKEFRTQRGDAEFGSLTIGISSADLLARSRNRGHQEE
jgi:hypothetical protein